MSLVRFFVLPPAVLVTACAGVPADRGIQDVQALVTDRGGLRTEAAEGADTETLLRELLGHPLNAEDAVRVALLRNQEMQSVYAQLGVGQADLLQASRLSNPTLSLSALVPDSDESVRIGYGLAQNFTDLLFLSSRTRIAEGELARAKEIAGRRIQQLATEVTAAWYRLVGARQVADMRVLIAGSARVSADVAQRFRDAGNITELDLRLQQAAATKAELDAEAAQADAITARFELNRLMGLRTAEATWKTSVELPLPVAKEDELATLQALGARFNLDISAKRREVETLSEVRDLAQRWRWFGIVEVGVEGERDTDGTHLIGPTVSLQLPLFHQGQASLLRAESLWEQSRAELVRLEADVDNAIAAARERVLAARGRAERYRREQIPQREQIVERTQEQVNYMLVGVFELIRAKQDEYDAYQGYLEALRGYWLARVELSRTVGARLPSDRQIAAGGAAAVQLPDIPPPPAHGGHGAGHEAHGNSQMDHSGHDMHHMPDGDRGGHDMQEPDHSGHDMQNMTRP